MDDVKTNADEAGGELVFFGATDWAMIGRTDSKKPKAGAPPPQSKSDRAAIYPNLSGPHRIASLQNVAITHVAAGSASCHCVALDIDGRCFTWGRNESGQLGHGDTTERHVPTVVARLTKEKVVGAAAGKFHTVIITAEKTSFSWGGNKHGALGTGSLRKDVELFPTTVSITKPTAVACGSDFTVWLTETPGATIMTAGLPQYGQLGHGTDNEYNAKDSSVKLMYEPQPLPRAISSLAASTINRVACGNNHTVAADSEGLVYTWGFGGHGRLGHKEQKDEFRPRKVEIFTRHNTLPATGIVAAGASFCAATAGGGQLYMWGKVKSTGDSWMYPKANQDLSGWHIRHMDCGNTSSAVAADSSSITWGTALYGELGYGESGPKSSAAAKKVDALEGARAIKAACGVGHTMVIVSREGEGKEVIKKGGRSSLSSSPMKRRRHQEEQRGGEGDEGAEAEEPTTGGECEWKGDGAQDEEEEEDEEEKVEAKAGSKRRGGGRGAAAKRGRGGKGKAAAAPEETGAAKRGRGRGRGRGKK